MKKEIAIIGAGISGLACALHLARRGFPVTIWEHRSAHELFSKDYIASLSSGRAMSMDLSARGIYALKQVGVFDDLESKGVPMTHRIFHDRTGNLIPIAYGPTSKHCILAIARSDLFQALLNAALRINNITINFSHKFEDINFNTHKIILKNINNQEFITCYPHIIIGADGINSASRAAFEKYSGLCFSYTPMPQSYKELSISKELGIELEHNAMHIWSRDDLMLVAQPNADHSFTCALLMPPNGPLSFEAIHNKNDIENLFLTNFRDVYALMPRLIEEYQQNHIGHLRILQGKSWTCDGSFVLIGDAAHGMVPFFGQGVNCCFEDCSVLDQCLDEANNHWPTALLLFDQRRVINGNAISTMSFTNYPELLERGVLEHVLLKKQIESSITKIFPEKYISYHNLVCFHRVPYIYALACKKLQEPLLERLASRIHHIEELNMSHVEQEVLSYEKQLSALKETYAYAL
jgi:kynurenine 3-monooxygenase